MHPNTFRYLRVLNTLSPAISEQIHEEILWYERSSRYNHLEEKLQTVLDVEHVLAATLKAAAVQTAALQEKVAHIETQVTQTLQTKPYSKAEAEHYYLIIALEKQLSQLQQHSTDLEKSCEDKQRLFQLRKKIVKARDKLTALKAIYSP